MDRETLTKQISSVRDAAVEMLQQLASGTTNEAKGFEDKAGCAGAAKKQRA